jgi:CRISPR-associated protein Csm4
MKTYRVRLGLDSASLSAWQSDTIFGHLCWTVRYEKGEEALGQFLAPFLAGEPPLVLSNGFPGDLLPRPVLPPESPPGLETPKRDQVAAMRRVRQGKGINHVDLDEFNAICRGERVLLRPQEARVEDRTVLKNLINRLTGTTTGSEAEEAAGGNLYDLQEILYLKRRGLVGEKMPVPISIYLKVIDDHWEKRIRELFGRMALVGFGAKKSTGYGQFEVESFKPFDGFAAPDGANGFVSLSNFVPAQADPVDGHYETLVKYGKLGEEFASSGDISPFKFPLLMLAAGATFRDDNPRDFYGRMVAGVHPRHEHIVQYGYAFAVPIVLPSGGGNSV